MSTSHDHHDHSHHHHHHHPIPQSFNTAFGFAISLNLIFAMSQIIFAFLAHSMSLMADAVHNVGDVVGLVFAWGANWLMTLPARKRYSYGFKRITMLASLANALILVGTSSIIIYESIRKLFLPVPVQAHWMLVVALLGIVINGGTALLFMKGSHDDLNIKSAFFHLLADAFLSLGVVIAAILIVYTGRFWIDPVMGLLIVATILYGTWQLLRESISLILDAVPHYINSHEVEAYLGQFPGVTAVHDLHIWGLSTKEIALTAHLIMPDTRLTDADFQKINHDLKMHYRIDHATLQVEEGSREYPCERLESC